MVDQCLQIPSCEFGRGSRFGNDFAVPPGCTGMSKNLKKIPPIISLAQRGLLYATSDGYPAASKLVQKAVGMANCWSLFGKEFSCTPIEENAENAAEKAMWNLISELAGWRHRVKSDGRARPVIITAQDVEFVREYLAAANNHSYNNSQNGLREYFNVDEILSANSAISRAIANNIIVTGAACVWDQCHEVLQCDGRQSFEK